MTKSKDLKRVVRARMAKTGEAYTAARAQVLAKPPRGGGEDASGGVAAEPAAAAPAAAAPVVDYAGLAGMSDEVIAARTGCTWEQWVGHLDFWGAAEKPHGEIAEHLRSKFGVPDWWCQAVTVGYERIRGLREIGQRRGGAYEASKSKTVAAPIERLFAAWAEPELRARWLAESGIVVRKATAPKSVRITWPDGSNVEVWLTAKGTGKSSVAVQHGKLPSRERAGELKRYWAERLEVLAALLAEG